MESLRSVLLLALILVFVAVKGEYPVDYDCEDFRQAKKEKVCEKFNGTCPGECPGECKVCCFNESHQCQCLDVQPPTGSRENTGPDDMSPAHFFHCKGGINGSKLEGNEDVSLRDLCEEIEFDTFAEDGCHLCFVLAESSEYRVADVDDIEANATSVCNPSKEEFEGLKVPRGLSNRDLNQCNFKELRAYKKCLQGPHKLVDTEILIPRFKHQPEDEKMCIKFMGMNMDDNDMNDYENGTDFVIDEQGRGLWNGSKPPPIIQVNETIGRLRDMDITNLEAAVFIREYEVERQLRYKMSHGDHRCRYGHFLVTDRPLWVGQFSEISELSGDIRLDNNDIFTKLRPEWYGCHFCGPAYLYIVLDPFNKLRDRKGCRCDGWHKVQKINIPCHWRDDQVSIQPIVVPHDTDHGDFLMYCDYGHISFHGVHCSRGIDMERTDVYNLLDEMEFTNKPGEGYGPTGRCVKRNNRFYDHHYQEEDDREMCEVEAYSAQMLLKFKQRFMNISGETCENRQNDKSAMDGSRGTQDILRVVEKHCEKRQSDMKNRSYSDEPEFDDIMIEVDDEAEDCGLRRQRMIDNPDDSKIEACLERNRSSVVNALIKSDMNDTDDMRQQNLTMKALMKIVCSEQKNMDSPAWCERLARCTMYSISSERENIKGVVRDDDNQHNDRKHRRKRSERPEKMLNNGQRYLQAIYHKCHDRLTNVKEDMCPDNIDRDDHKYDHHINIYDEYWNLTYRAMGEGRNMSAGKNDSSRMFRQKRSLIYGYYDHYSEAPEGPGILRDYDGVREVTDALRGSWTGWGPCDCDDIRVQKCGDQKLREYFEDDTKGLCVGADFLEDHHKCSKEHFKQAMKNFQQLYGYDLTEAKRRARKCCVRDLKPKQDDVRCSYCTKTMKGGLYVYKYLALDEPKCKLIGVTQCPECHSYDYSGNGYGSGYGRGSGYGSGSGYGRGSGYGSGSGYGRGSGYGSGHGKGNFSDHGKASGNEPK